MAQIQEELILYDKFTNTFNKYIRLTDQASGATSQAKKSIDQFERSERTAAQSTDALSSKISGLVSGLVGLQGLRWLVGMSDSMTEITARLNMMNDGLQTTAELQDMIYRSAQRSRASYQDTAAFVAKLGTLAGDAFDSNEELIAFAEQINKQITLSGASSAEAAGAMLQLTQALSSGMLRGEELNSVLEQTPMIAQTIADYMGVTVGEMRELASEGKITADVVKNAMFAAADDVNEKFEQMPVTWSQVWTQFKNSVIQNIQPVLDAVSELAQKAVENIDTLIPAFFGLASAVTFYAVAQGIANGALNAFFALMTGHPVLLAVATLIGVIVNQLYKWAQSIGGVTIAWKTLVDWVSYGWDIAMWAFETGLSGITWVIEELKYAFIAGGIGILNFLRDLESGVLLLLQDLVNGAIGIINDFINVLNKIPGVAIEPIKELTFGSTAYLENEAQKQADREYLAELRDEINQDRADRQARLDETWNNLQKAHEDRLKEIEELKEQNAAVGDGDSDGDDDGDGDGKLDGIADDVSSIEKSVNMADEDLQQLIDMAERQYVNRINLTAQTPVITVNGANTGNTQADRQALANTIRDILLEQAASGATRSTARVFSGG